MSTYVSGLGGYVQISMDGSSWTTLDVAEWTLTRTARTTENTHSGCSATNYDVVCPDNSWRLSAPWNQDGPLDSLVTQSKIYVRFKHGSGAVLRQCSLTTVESIETVDQQSNDIVRVTMQGRGGVVS
jgi:hypothetical protein